MSYYSDDHVTIHLGDSLNVLPTLPADSVDAVVTDPPYGIGFMGHEWDQPGKYAATRSNGTPGPHMRRAHVDHTTTTTRDGAMEAGRYDLSRPANARFGDWCEAWARECYRVLKPGGHIVSFGGTRTWHRLQTGIEDAGFEIRDCMAWLFGSGFPKSLNLTDEHGARTGWGTALKPGFEPMAVGRKPTVGTVAANVLQHGTGALHIDACRTSTNGEQLHRSTSWNDMRGGHYGSGHRASDTDESARPAAHDGGRWPTNVLLDQDAAAELDRQTGVLTSGTMRAGTERQARTGGTIYGADARNFVPADTYGDSGGASRFFPTFHYEAKAPGAERPRGDDGTAHPTVKPLDLMRWLVRLVTPAGGIVLDPFLGSGTTAEACVIEGFRCIGIERHEPYAQLSIARLGKPIQQDMFGGLG